MFKNFLKDSAIYTVSTVLARGIGIFLIPIYTRMFSPTDYGVIDILAVVASLVNLTIALEISQAVARYFPDVKTVEEKRAFASTALWFTIIVNCIFLIVVQYYCNTIGPLVLGSLYNETLFRVALFSMATSGIFNILQMQLRFQLQSFQYALVSIITLLVSVFVILVLIFVAKWGLISVFIGQLVGNVIGALASYRFGGKSYALVFDTNKLKQMLAFSAPLVPSSIGVFIAVYIDRIAIKELMTMADVGLYGIAYRIASMVSLIMVGVNSALMPLVYNNYKQANTPTEIARIFRYFLWAAIMFFLGLSLFARELLVIFTTPQFYGAYTVVPILVLAVILSGMYVFAPGLAIAKKTSLIAGISITTAFINTVLNFTLIPYLGISGSALATLIGTGMQFSLFIWLGNKYYVIPFEWKRYAAATLGTIILVILGGLIKTSFWLGIGMKLLITIVALIYVTWIMIDWEEFRKIKQIIFRQEIKAMLE